MRTALLFVASFFFVILRGLGAPAQETDDQTAIRKPILKRDQALINDVETAPAALPATLDAALAQALRSNPDVLLANAALRQAEGGTAADSRGTSDSFAALIAMVGEKKISHSSGKQVLATLVVEGGDPVAIVEREGLAQISDSGELESVVAAAVEANPEAAEQVRAGNQKAIGAIVGAVMKETKGRADGGEVNRLIREKLEI